MTEQEKRGTERQVEFKKFARETFTSKVVYDMADKMKQALEAEGIHEGEIKKACSIYKKMMTEVLESKAIPTNSDFAEIQKTARESLSKVKTIIGSDDTTEVKEKQVQSILAITLKDIRVVSNKLTKMIVAVSKAMGKTISQVMSSLSKTSKKSSRNKNEIIAQSVNVQGRKPGQTRL